MALSFNTATYTIESTASITDLPAFHAALRDWEDSEQGAIHPVTHSWKALDLGGGGFFYQADLLSPWVLKFPNAGNYTINGNLIGANEDWQAYVNANPLFAAGANGQTTRRPARLIQSWRDFMGFGERQRGGSQSRAGGNQPAPAAPPRVAYDAQGRRYVVRNGQWVAE